MKQYLTAFILIISNFVLFAQKGSLSITLDKDTIFQNDVIKIEFLLNNLSGKFTAPDFRSFSIVSGPNTSSTFSMMNGEVNQSKSISYILIPETSGNLTIGQASIESENRIVISDPIQIFVFDTHDKSGYSNSQKRIFSYDGESGTPTTSKESSKKRVLKKI